jgi:hypothetical protein
MDSGVSNSRNTIPRIPGDTKAERMDTKANRAAPLTSSDMIKNLDVKAAKQTKKFDYSPQFPAIWQLNDIPFIGSGNLQNTGSTVTDAYSSILHNFKKMPYLNSFLVLQKASRV